MTASVDVLTELDASFLYMESPHTPMHMGSIGIFEGGPLHDGHGCLRLDEVRTHVQGRLHLVPKLRKIVRLPLLGESAPAWVDDPDFDITYHVREAAVPEPGDEAQLLELCARLMSSPLDRDHPCGKLAHRRTRGRARGGARDDPPLHGRRPGRCGARQRAARPRGPSPHHEELTGGSPRRHQRTTVMVDGLAQFGGVVSMLAADAWHAAWHPSEASRALALRIRVLRPAEPRQRSLRTCR